MRRAVLSTCLVLAGCGRIGFTSSERIEDGMPADGLEPPVDAPPAVVKSCAVTKPDALLCESFEDPDVSWDYTVFENGSAGRSLVRAANGVASLDASISGGDDFKAARWGKNDVLPSLVSGELHVREWVYLASPTVITDQLSIMVTGNRADPFPSANILLRPGSIEVNVEGESLATAMEFPRDRWVCVQLELGLDGVNGTIKLTVDGQPLLQGGGFDTTVAGGYTNLDVGFHYATPAQAAARMFIDEVVADTLPISCE